MRRFSFLPIILSLVLTACGQSKPTNYYILKSTAAPVSVESMPRTTLNLPGYLDRAGIVLLDENGTFINIPRFNKWAEGLDAGAARLLRRSLTPVLLRQGITVLASEDTRVAAAYGVIVDIIRLEASTGGSIALEARWTLIDPGANRILGRGSFAGSCRGRRKPPPGTLRRRPRPAHRRPCGAPRLTETVINNIKGCRGTPGILFLFPEEAGKMQIFIFFL